MKKDNGMHQQNKRYYAFYKCMQGIFRVLFRLPFGIKKRDRIILPDEPCLVLANHCCYIDPIIVAISIKQPMSFVIAENLLRNKFMAWVFTKLLHCIPCAKGGQNAQTVFDIARELRTGHNVLMYPEGNMTYDGATDKAIPSTGKLIRSLKCTVVTMQVDGAYQLLPRWSRKFCFGQVRSHIVNVYETGYFYRKPVEEILDTINKDLYIEQPAREPADIPITDVPGIGTGVYGNAEKKNIPARTYNRGAAGLECFIFACPVCGKIGRIAAQGQKLRCGCGAGWIFTQYGFLENDVFEDVSLCNCPDADMGDPINKLLRPEGFSTLYEWNTWQQSYLGQLVAASREMTYSVPDTELCLITKDHRVEKKDAGTFTMTRDCVSCGDTSFPLSELSHMDTRDKGILLFSLHDGSYYEVVSKDIYPGLLFKTLFAARE
ncbi:MAG: 1-acyl-sn-glycerol-3-phosphate acyltransferase [Clostridiales bacterium]|nr:1-acyl-sn-glycerol-3-phosphate acyltransferase [Clostridiales bacterium]